MTEEKKSEPLNLMCPFCKLRPTDVDEKFLSNTKMSDLDITKLNQADCMMCLDCNTGDMLTEKNLFSRHGIWPYSKVYFEKENLKHLSKILEFEKK